MSAPDHYYVGVEHDDDDVDELLHDITELLTQRARLLERIDIIDEQLYRAGYIAEDKAP